MTLPASGEISMSQVSTEIGRASNYATTLNDADVRTLAGVPSGQIAFSNLHGKSWYSLYNPTPGGWATYEALWPSTSTAWVRAHPDGVFRDQDNNYTQFGSLWATSIASSKYWRWWYKSGTSPTHTNMTEWTWYPVNDSYYVGQTRSTNGANSGEVYIAMANDSAGNGATTAGVWTLEALRSQD